MGHHAQRNGEASRAANRSRSAAVASALLVLVAGCAQSGPISRRTTMVGALKTNVAQLESEKDGLAREVAELKTENRRMENELAVVTDQNGDLAARLDDARAVMGRQGIDDGRSSGASRSASDSERPAKRRAAPAKNSPKSRKTPFAQIPGERRPVVDPEEGNLDAPSSRDDRDDLGPQSRADDRSPWMPVARGRNSPLRALK